MNASTISGLPAVRIGILCVVLAMAACASDFRSTLVDDPVVYVDPLIGTANGGNAFPGAVVPFGMVAWSPETTRGDPTRRPAPGGYQYDATRVRGFSLTHLSGTGCRGASGDVPILPWTGSVDTSPSADLGDRAFTVSFAHANERAEAGYYQVRLRSGVNVELSATTRTGAGRFTFPPEALPSLLFRVSDSEVGSGDAHVVVDTAARTVSGQVSSGNFCGYIDPVMRHDYYTVYFVAVFDREVVSTGAWQDATVTPGATEARGGTGYGDDGYPVAGKGSGAWVTFDPADGTVLNVRVGISYVSLENARANLEEENPAGTSLESVREQARSAWNERLGQIRVGGGTEGSRRVFYTALYHALLHPNVFSDVDRRYMGFDGVVHTLRPSQAAQYANFSGWDVYRSQLQLVTLLDARLGGDIAQSLYNQAEQNGGVWDRWTHNTGATHVMEGDASTLAVSAIHAFGGTGFDVPGAMASLLKAARTPTALDLSHEGCPVMCPGQRPSLDQWLTLHYVPTEGAAWGGAGETLEDVSADFALGEMAARVGDTAAYKEMRARSGYWRNLYNPEATATDGYIQDRNADGSWRADFDPGSSEGFAEGSSAQYTWMIPFDPKGLFQVMGGDTAAVRRLDDFFHTPDGGWALTGLGSLHADMYNEPSIASPWMYLWAGRADRAQETVRAVREALWSDRPHGIPGNDDLGAMSAWYVWTSLGMYPGIPGRAELLLTAPAFPAVELRRKGGAVVLIEAPGAEASPYIEGLAVNGEERSRSWLPASFVADGGSLRFDLATTPDAIWGRSAADVPPSFGPEG